MREITSDNHGGRPTGEDNLMGDYGLLRGGILKPGRRVSGSLIWSDVHAGRQTATIGNEVHMPKKRGWARLFYTTASWSGETAPARLQAGTGEHAPALRRPALVVDLPEAGRSRLQALQA
jgi:hypothetical protein